MKRYLHSAALLLIGISTAIPALGECPDGKSEVLLMTPSGKTKTICVSDNAIPGIENAAGHNGGFTLEPACPCLDVWDGAPYPEGTEYTETQPPALPDDLTGVFCTAWASPELTSVRADIVSGGELYVYGARAVTEDRSRCSVDTTADNAEGGYAQLVEPPTIFPDAAISPTGQYTSSMVDACKAILEARGCVFPFP